MKRNLLVIALVLSILTLGVPSVQASPASLIGEAAYAPAASLVPPAVTVNGQQIYFDVSPVLINSRWLVPMRAIFEALDAEVQWDNSTQTAYAVRESDNVNIQLQLNKPTAMVNYFPVSLDSPATAIDGRVLVPLRFVSEALDSVVTYDDLNNTVVITSSNHVNTPAASSLISDATMCESVDGITLEPIGAGTTFGADLEQICAYVELKNILDGRLAINWYHISGDERIFVTSDGINGDGASNVLYFALDQDYFQTGSWQCDLIINQQLARTLDFTITGSTPPIHSASNSHPWKDWGLGSVEEEYVDNDNRSYDWYVDQYNTGTYWYENCGPSVVTMVCKWSDPSFHGTAEQARNTYLPNGGWWTIDIKGNSAEVNNYLELYDIPYEYRGSTTSSEDLTSRMKSDLRGGHIIILCIDSHYISENFDDDERTGKPYSTGVGSGHFIIVKGFAVVDGETWFEVYDPANGNKEYDDGTPMCKNRYYSATDIHRSMSVWWNRYLYADQVDSTRILPSEDIQPDNGWPAFSRPLISIPAWGAYAN